MIVYVYNFEQCNYNYFHFPSITLLNAKNSSSFNLTIEDVEKRQFVF